MQKRINDLRDEYNAFRGLLVRKPSDEGELTREVLNAYFNQAYPEEHPHMVYLKGQWSTLFGAFLNRVR